MSETSREGDGLSPREGAHGRLEGPPKDTYGCPGGMGLPRALREALDRRLDELVERAGRATSSDGVFVYIVEGDEPTLVLRAATEGRQSQFRGKLFVPIGEGVAGWVARRRETAIIQEDSAKDPRFLLVPDLSEEMFASMMALPVLSAKSSVLGAVAFYSMEPHHYSDDRIFQGKIVAEAVALVIDQAYDSRDHEQHAVFAEQLERTLQLLASGRPIDECVSRMCEMIIDSLSLDAATIAMVHRGSDGVHGALGPRASRSRLSDGGRLAQALCAKDAESLNAAEIPADAVHGWSIFSCGTPPQAILLCYRERELDEIETRLLAGVADGLALVATVDRLADEQSKRDPAWHLHTVLADGISGFQAEDIARSVGVNLDARHVVLNARVSPVKPALGAGGPNANTLNGALDSLEHALVWGFPGSCASRSATLMRALIEVPSQDDVVRLRRDVAEIIRKVRDSLAVEMSVGVGTVVEPSIKDYSDAYRNAHEAFSIGENVVGRGSLVLFDDLGYVGHLHRLARDASIPRDRYMVALESVEQYDRERRTSLINTLDCFMGCQGNITVAAQRLYVHRNTLRQRLARIEEIMGISLDSIEDWFPLQLACRLLVMRAALSPAEKRGGAEAGLESWLEGCGLNEI